MIKVGFLIIISPLISLTYTIDKMGDGKAQALGNWLKEFIFTILIQPFHCIMYLAFVRTAFSLIVGEQDVSIFQAFTDIPALFTDGDFNQIVNGALAILCLKFIKDGEDIVRKIFGFQDDNSSTSFAAGMAVSMLAVSNAKKIGASARKGINFAKQRTGGITKALSKDSSRFVNNKWAQSNNILKKGIGLGGRYAGKAIQKIDSGGKALGNLGNKAQNSLIGKKISGFKSSVKGNIGKFKSSKIGGFISRHNSLASTLGLMGMAMAYGSGNTGALEAYGYGNAIEQGTGEFFNSSDKNIAESQISSDVAEDKKELDQINTDLQKVDSQLENSKENDTENYEKAENIYGDYKTKKQNLDNATEKRNNIKAEKENPKITRDEYAKKEKELEEADKELEKAKKEFEESKEKFESKDDPKLKDIIDKMTKKEHLEQKRDNFYTPEAILSRINSRREGSSKEKLRAKKKEIIEKLTELKLSKRGNSSENNGLTTEESDSIEKTADKLINSISHGVLTGEGFSTDAQKKVIENSLGIRNDDNEIYQSLMKSTSDYETEKSKENKAEAYKFQASYGGNGDNLAEKEAQMLIDRYRAEGKYKASEHSA